VVRASFDRDDRSDSSRQGDRLEDLIQNAFIAGTGPCPSRRSSTAHRLAQRDAEILSGCDLNNALAFERLNQRGALALIELVADAELPSPLTPQP
jgi:hypothetical protein